jgi:pimeloyl-ACP methyl ester carboxylesterase
VPTQDVDGLAMYYEIHGEGEPVVLILGLGQDMSEESWFIGELAKGHRVLAFDNRGAGRTGKPDAPYTLEGMAQDVAGLMRAVDMPQATVVGVSMGGRIALALALDHPDLVTRLALVSTSARVVKSLRRSLAVSLLPRIPVMKGKYPQPFAAFKRQREASASYDCSARLSEIRVPTTILHGKKDSLAPYPLAEELHRGIAGARLLTFEGGHMFFLMRERQAFVKALDTAL